MAKGLEGSAQLRHCEERSDAAIHILLVLLVLLVLLALLALLVWLILLSQWIASLRSQ